MLVKKMCWVEEWNAIFKGKKLTKPEYLRYERSIWYRWRLSGHHADRQRITEYVLTCLLVVWLACSGYSLKRIGSLQWLITLQYQEWLKCLIEWQRGSFVFWLAPIGIVGRGSSTNEGNLKGLLFYAFLLREQNFI